MLPRDFHAIHKQISPETETNITELYVAVEVRIFTEF